jgi:hypothetical protein
VAASLALSVLLDAQRRPGSGPPPRPPRTARPAAPPSGGLSGTLSPRAIGRPAPTPAPIGGLRTRPLNSPPIGAGDRRFRDGYDDRYRDRFDRNRDGDRDGFGNRNRRAGPPRDYGYRPLGYGFGVADAPLPRGGVIHYDDRIETRVVEPKWFPRVDRPRWRRDTSVRPVQAWVDLIVNDVVCDGYGSCMERESRARAPWVAVCRCYIFTDAIGRRWEVGAELERW